jgi:hypothetical protein
VAALLRAVRRDRVGRCARDRRGISRLPVSGRLGWQAARPRPSTANFGSVATE